MDSLNSFIQEKRKEEYQIQHFEFCSLQYAHEAKEEVMSVIEDAASAFERSLFEKYSSVDREKIQLATRKLIETYSVAIEEWRPSFQERLDSNFLSIPSHVLLDEDKPQEVQYTKEEIDGVDRGIRDLEKKIIGLKYMKTKLGESLKAAKKALDARSKCIHSTQTVGPSSCDLVKAVDTVIRKRRKYQEMDGCILGGSFKKGIFDDTLALKTKASETKGETEVSEMKLKIRKMSPEL